MAAVLMALAGSNTGAMAEPVSSASPVCAITDLPGLAAQFARARRLSRIPSGAPDPEAVADAWRVARAVVGPPADAVAAAPSATDGAPAPLPVPCDASVHARDGAAWQLGLGGYSAREVADVLEGHLTRTDLDEARRQLMAGIRSMQVTAFLEARWREAAPLAPASKPRAQPRHAPVPSATTRLAAAELAGDVDRLAILHDVPARLIRAVIAAESAGNARAVSSAGAIGLMQLMPETARALGVDPWLPRDNLRGGVAYLARLLRSFDDNPRLALIAYNAGPGHARDVRAGRAVAYRETRQYLATIAAHYPLE